MPALAPEAEEPAERPSPSTLELMNAIAFESLALCDSATCTNRPALNGVVGRVISRNQPLSPPVVPAQAALALLWLARRTGDESLTAADADLFAALRSGAVLCAAIKAPVMPITPLTAADIPATRNIEAFLSRARRLVPGNPLFAPEDILLQRNLPKVVRALAAVSAHLPPSFASLAAHVPGARALWTVDDEPDEMWDGDGHARRLARAAGPERRLGIVVAGPQGAGKSATATALMGRLTAPATPRLTVELPDSCFAREEARRRQRARGIRAQNWPARPWESGAAIAETDVQKLNAKIAGIALSVWEIPATKSRLEMRDSAIADIHALGGDFGDIQRALQGGRVDVVLLVARSDLFQRDEFASACGDLHRLFGPSVWGRVVLVLTHADALPPSGELNSEYCVRTTEEAALDMLKQFRGARVRDVQVVAVDTGSGTGMSELAETAAHVIEQPRTGEKIVALPLKRWWEDYLFGALAVWAITRL